MKKIIALIALILMVGSNILFSSETFAGSYTPSRNSMSPSQISFSNNSTNNSVAIYWVDFDGNERYYTTLNPRASYVQDTYIGHVWNVRNTSDSTLLATIVSNSTYQQNTINSTSQSSTTTASPSYPTSSSKIYFTNSSNVNVTIYWVDQNGNERNYRTLVPGETYTQDTSIDHIWVVRHSRLGTEVGRTVSTNSYQTYTITQRFVESYNTTYTTNSNVTYFPNSYPTYGSYYNNNYTPQVVTYGYYPTNYNSYSSTSSSNQAVCNLYDGTYNNNNFTAVINGSDIVQVTSFRKKWNKISFSTYGTSPSGMTQTLRWTLNCSNGIIVQR